MLLPRIRTTAAGSQASLTTIENVLSNLRLSQAPSISANPTTTTIRHASHQAQGRANGAKDGPGKRLGAKKSGEQYVIPGNIIFRQRGTHWFPGDNVGMGRDHTIYATQPGFVKYYRDPLKHPKRQYIGVVFARGQTLPQPPNAVRRRRLGMLAHQMMPESEAGATWFGGGDLVPGAEEVALAGNAEAGVGLPSTVREAPREARGVRVRKDAGGVVVKAVPTLRPGYQYRQANWEIGRAAERARIQVKAFKPRDRFTAWRKTTVRKAKNAEKKGMRRRK